jgi:hypothetical protein
VKKDEVVAAHKTGIRTIHTKFQDYRVHHRNKLHEFRTNLEKAVNKFGVKCLPYQGENSPINEVVGWFDRETQALSTAIVKANKNFVCYCIAGVPRMLYENGCGHVEGLQTVMTSCDVSILDDIPEETGKLIGRIVKKWWATHGLPYTTELFCITPEVGMFFICFAMFVGYVDIYFCCCGSM